MNNLSAFVCLLTLTTKDSAKVLQLLRTSKNFPSHLLSKFLKLAKLFLKETQRSHHRFAIKRHLVVVFYNILRGVFRKLPRIITDNTNRREHARVGRRASMIQCKNKIGNHFIVAVERKTFVRRSHRPDFRTIKQ